MSVELYTLIVMQVVNIILSLCGPLVSGFIAFTQRVKHSKCMGSEIELSAIEKIHEEIKQNVVEQKKLTRQLRGFVSEDRKLREVIVDKIDVYEFE
jgi:hypothetical protein